MQLSISVATISFLLFHFSTALTITSPSAGDNLDPTQPITVQWTSTSSDPATFDLILDNTNQLSLVKNKKVATSVSTSSGSYVLSTAALMTYGAGFVFKAEDSLGNVLSTSGSFDLATGVVSVSSSSSDGRVSTVSPSASIFASSSISSSTTDTSSTDSFFAQTTGTDTIAALTTSTTSNTMTTSNGFFTSTTSRATSGTRSDVSSAASATTSANAQPRTGSSSQIVFSAAGILAGLVALLA